MLKIDWAFKKDGSKGQKAINFDHLVQVLANASYNEVLSTELVIHLAEHFYEEYYYNVFYRLFIPVVIYFVSTVYLLSNSIIDK